MAKFAAHPRPFVLLTGATGLVGSLVLARLLSCNLPVAVLVRGNRRESAGDRFEGQIRRLEERLGKLLLRPVVLSGNLSGPGLGLNDTDKQWIADNCSSVIHSAANLLFRPASEHPDNEPYRTNIDGTKHLLDVMTKAGITEWHYVSTAYISGVRSGRISESDTNVGQEFANDYERSKMMAEQLLRECCNQADRNGGSVNADSQNPLNPTLATFSSIEKANGETAARQRIHSLTVYRPSIVIDQHLTNSMQSDQTINNAFDMFQALSQRFGLPDPGDWFRRLGFSGHERKNIVTVDWVATMISQIYRRPSLHGQTYHLTSPTGTSVAELEDAFRAAVLNSGIMLPPRQVEIGTQLASQAAPFVAVFKPYFRDDPTFDRTNTERAMQVCGEADSSELTVADLRDFCMQQSKPTVPSVALKQEASTWSEFVRSIDRRSAALMQPAQQRDALIGLELCGPGGGQWLIEESSSGWSAEVAAASLAAVRFFLSAATLNQLISRQLFVSTALESGLLVFEDDATDASSVRSPIERFSRLIDDVRQHSRQRGDKSEVAHVR